MPSEFDPRRHSAVAFNVSERLPVFYGTKGQVAPMKSFMVGPNAPDKVASLRAGGARPNTAPAGSSANSASPTIRKNSDAHPRFLNVDGQWVQKELPTLIADSQAQSLCASGTLKATLTMTGKQAPERSIRPLTAVHTYNDISPVTTAEYVRDGDAMDPIQTQRLAPVEGNAASNMTSSSLFGESKSERSMYTMRAKAIGNTQARVDSIDHFWNRHNGSYNLAINDLDRIDELAKNVVPGTPNARLVHGRWRYITRPVEGDVIYTDYYGRYASEHCNYYGRRYEMGAEEFAKNPLVGDSDYTKVQASMQGIHTLRTRPGLSLDATIASAVPSARLEALSPYKVEQRGIHRIHQHARLRPHTAPTSQY